ncbi:MAG: hypothetical protein ABEJ66_03935, partial [Candidatus Nanohaloarchaea archaeon]
SFEDDLVLATKRETADSLRFDLDVPEDELEVIDPYSQGWQARILNKYKELVEHNDTVERAETV